MRGIEWSSWTTTTAGRPKCFLTTGDLTWILYQPGPDNTEYPNLWNVALYCEGQELNPGSNFVASTNEEARDKLLASVRRWFFRHADLLQGNECQSPTNK